MGWKEREIFGKIRFMNYNGCKRKFKINEFVHKHPPAAENAAIAGKNQTVANRTKKRNKLAAPTARSILTAPSSSDNDDDDKITKHGARNTTNGPAKKRQKKTANINVNAQVEDLSGLSKSALSKKTVKVLKSYIQFRGASIKSADGKPLLKAGLIEVSISLSS